MSELFYNRPQVDLVSESACLLRFSDAVNNETADRISIVAKALRELPGIVDLIPSYTTLLTVFDADHYDRFAIVARIRQLIEQLDYDEKQLSAAREVVIPVYYGPEVGPDLDEVAQHCRLSVNEIISLHSETSYRAYAIGFTPGFAFLGNTPEVLHVPRKNTPRLKVPLGSVAIAERQTAVYPSVTPGGWQIIGRTPVTLVDWSSESLALIQGGDTVRFTPISRAEFIAQGGTLDGF